MGVYKVSSSDLTNIPFIEHQARKGKPMILSVGAGDLTEMRSAVQAVRAVNDSPLALLHCVLEYPTPYEHANLSRIASITREFPDVIVGYSDHCKPDPSAEVVNTAYVLGARIVEKHFTLDKTLPGNDHYHAMDPSDARTILEGVCFVETLLGDSSLRHSESETAARANARRSLVAAADIPAGSVIDKGMLTFKRPGTGISPSLVGEVVGRVARVDIPADVLIDMTMLSDSRYLNGASDQ